MRLTTLSFAAAAALGFAALPLAAPAASARDWDDRFVQRCDNDGDTCATFRCDRYGDDCVRVSAWTNRSAYDRYYRYPSYYRSYTTRQRCDYDGDNCVTLRCDADGDNCHTISSY